MGRPGVNLARHEQRSTALDVLAAAIASTHRPRASKAPCPRNPAGSSEPTSRPDSRAEPIPSRRAPATTVGWPPCCSTPWAAGRSAPRAWQLLPGRQDPAAAAAGVRARGRAARSARGRPPAAGPRCVGPPASPSGAAGGCSTTTIQIPTPQPTTTGAAARWAPLPLGSSRMSTPPLCPATRASRTASGTRLTRPSSGRRSATPSSAGRLRRKVGAGSVLACA